MGTASGMGSEFVWKALCVPALMILPFFLLLICVHPEADDFILGASWRDSGLLAMLSDQYFGWSGRLVGLGLAPLPVMIHYSSGLDILVVYRLLCGSTLLAIVSAALYCSMRLFPKAARPVPLFAGLLLATALVAGAPDPEELVFWFTGISFYTVPSVVTLLIAVRLFTKAGDQTPISYLEAGVIMAAGFAMAMTSEFSGPALILVIASSYAQRWMTTGPPRQGALFSILILVIAAGTLVVLLAPGNAVRLDALGRHGPVIFRALQAIPLALLDVVIFLFRRLTNPALIGSMAILALVAIESTPLPLHPVSGLKPVTVVAPLAAAFAAIALGLWMGRTGTGQMLEQRAQNQLHFILVASLASCIVLAVRNGCGGRFSAITRRFRLYDVRAAAVVFLSLMLITPQFLIASDILVFHSLPISGAISDRFVRIGPGRVPGAAVLERELVLPRLPNSPAYFHDYLSEDSEYWMNRGLASYIGVRTVRVEMPFVR